MSETPYKLNEKTSGNKNEFRFGMMKSDDLLKSIGMTSKSAKMSNRKTDVFLPPSRSEKLYKPGNYNKNTKSQIQTKKLNETVKLFETGMVQKRTARKQLWSTEKSTSRSRTEIIQISIMKNIIENVPKLVVTPPTPEPKSKVAEIAEKAEESVIKAVDKNDLILNKLNNLELLFKNSLCKKCCSNFCNSNKLDKEFKDMSTQTDEN